MDSYEEFDFYQLFMNDEEFRERMRDFSFAKAFSSQIAQVDRYFYNAQGDEVEATGFSYRSAGAIVSEMRNQLYKTGEDYITFAWCGAEFGDEDLPVDEVLGMFDRLGVYEKKWVAS